MGKLRKFKNVIIKNTRKSYKKNNKKLIKKYKKNKIDKRKILLYPF